MEYLNIIGFLILAFITFVIYFVFKILEFVMQAINLYKKILNRQDAILVLLSDIRDNTKVFERNSINKADSTITSRQNDSLRKCIKCNSEISSLYKRCPECGANLEEQIMHCEKCNAEIEPNTEFCQNCGEKLR